MVVYLHDYYVKSYICGNVVILLLEYVLCNCVYREVSYKFLDIIFCIFSIISYNFFGGCQSKCTTSMKSQVMCLHDMFKVQHGLIITLYVNLLSCYIDVCLYLVKLK
jgi:hypothetical protein